MTLSGQSSAQIIRDPRSAAHRRGWPAERQTRLASDGVGGSVAWPDAAGRCTQRRHRNNPEVALRARPLVLTIHLRSDKVDCAASLTCGEKSLARISKEGIGVC